MHKKILIFVMGICVAAVFAWGADTITKGLIGKEDLYFGTDNVPAQTFSRATSTGHSITLTRINGSHIPWDNSYTRTIRPLSIVGNGTGSISGYSIASLPGLILTGNLTGKSATFDNVMTSLSVATGALTSTGITVTGNISASAVGSFGSLTLNTRTRTTGTAAPTSGTYVTGAIVYNTAPASATVISANPTFWVCTAAGTPGTWRAIYPVFLVAPDNVTALGKPGMTAYDNTYFYANAPAADNSWKRVALATW